MFSYWIKKRFALSIVLSIIFTAAFIIAFVIPYALNSTENELNTGVYKDCEISYDIPSPTKTQLDEIRSQSFVDDAFGYYITDAAFSYAGNSIKATLMISDCTDSIEMTMFNSRRVVESGNLECEIPLYVGSDFANTNNLKIGDKLSYGEYELTVTAIYEPDTYKECVLVPIDSGAFLEMIESKTTAYSGAYIKVNDPQAAESYLRSYKPEGRLKDKSAFSTDEEYQIHYDAWSNANYFNEITSFEEKLSEVHLVDVTMIWIGVASYLILMVVTNVILFIRKTERVYFKTRKSKRGLKSYYVLTMLSDFCFSAVTSVCSTYLVGLFSKNYISQTAYISSSIIAAVTIVGTIIICFLMNISLVGSVIKSNNSRVVLPKPDESKPIE